MLLHPPYSTDFILSHYHLFSPLGNKKPARMSTTPTTGHWRMPLISGYRRGTAAFTRQEYMILFNGQKRLSTKMQNTPENNCTFRNSVATFSDIFTCPTHKHHETKNIWQYFLTASCNTDITTNQWHKLLENCYYITQQNTQDMKLSCLP